MTDAMTRIWGHPALGRALKTVLAYVGLYAGIKVGLRNNPPPPGVFVQGALLGLLYALVAFGLILIYRATRIINFAQTEMGAVGAVLAVLLIKIHHWPYLAAFAVAMGVALVSGLVVDVAVIRRFNRAPRLVLSVATIGVALIFAVIQFYLPQWLGAKELLDPVPPKTPFSSWKFHIDPLTFDANSIVIVLAVGLVIVGLWAFFRFSRIGIGVRAAAENADRARLLGISTGMLSSVVWMLATVLSALGVFLRIPVIGLPIGADVGPFILLFGLSAAVIAKMDSFFVAAAAAVWLSVLDQCIYYFTHDGNLGSAYVLPVLLVAMLLQRGRVSRGQDTGVATWSMAKEFRPIPPELIRLPEVEWGRFGAIALALATAVALPYVVGYGQQILASVIVIYGIVAVSLVILTGWAGQISLGQWGVAGVGALMASAVGYKAHGDFFLTLLVAGLAGAVAAILIGLPALRIQGLYLAVATLAFGIAVQVFLLSPSYFPALLPFGIDQIPRPRLYGRISTNGPRAFYFLCLAFLLLALLSARAVRRSRVGRVLIAARDNERGAASYGVSVPMARLTAFTISGFWAAIGGALFTYQAQTVNQGDFDPSISLLLLTIVVLGGVTSLPGAMLGTAFIGVLKYGGLSLAAQNLASGLGVLLILMMAPGGAAQAFYGARDALLRKVADRHGLVVPSLVADAKVEARDDQQEAAEALRHAAAVASLGRRPEPAGTVT
jgi:branched-chain amino acid transport system permease protein